MSQPRRVIILAVIIIGAIVAGLCCIGVALFLVNRLGVVMSDPNRIAKLNNSNRTAEC
jgi:hypothetical protein